MGSVPDRESSLEDQGNLVPSMGVGELMLWKTCRAVPRSGIGAHTFHTSVALQLHSSAFVDVPPLGKAATGDSTRPNLMERVEKHDGTRRQSGASEKSRILLDI